ncbi:MAG: YraN family protein [Oscillospiraceae bacterium]|nr:YraN family protein [Oscillospiraceae bacterium]
MTPQETGVLGERAVCYYLEALGYTVLERNFRIRGGEIDIVARRGDLLCFVEVKTRKLGTQAAGQEAVDARKRRHLIRAAYAYCEARDIPEEAYYLRYDIAEVTVQGRTLLGIDYLESAFDETDFAK